MIERMKTFLLSALVCSLFVVAVRGADEAATAAMLSGESLGELRINLAEKEVIKLLGQPAKRGELTYQEADGNYVQDWQYPAQGIDLTMSAGEKKTGAKTIVTITASAPCAFATKKGIKIGTEESVVRKAYAAFADRESPPEPGSYVVGSIYGGIIFNFEQGKVSQIFFGAAAE